MHILQFLSSQQTHRMRPKSSTSDPPKLGHVELCSLHPKREASIEQGAKQPARSTLLPEMPNISKICISFITFQDFPRSKDQDFWILEKFLNFLATLRNVPRWVVENSSLWLVWICCSSLTLLFFAFFCRIFLTWLNWTSINAHFMQRLGDLQHPEVIFSWKNLIRVLIYSNLFRSDLFQSILIYSNLFQSHRVWWFMMLGLCS